MYTCTTNIALALSWISQNSAIASQFFGLSHFVPGNQKSALSAASFDCLSSNSTMSAEASTSKASKKSRAREEVDNVELEEGGGEVNKNKRHRKDKRKSGSCAVATRTDMFSMGHGRHRPVSSFMDQGSRRYESVANNAAGRLSHSCNPTRHPTNRSSKNHPSPSCFPNIENRTSAQSGVKSRPPSNPLVWHANLTLYRER